MHEKYETQTHPETIPETNPEANPKINVRNIPKYTPYGNKSTLGHGIKQVKHGFGLLHNIYKIISSKVFAQRLI